MPELNHRFTAGRMNKDLDERLVPNGEYRDALNIEVASSEGSNVGSLQTIMGNVNLSTATIDPNENLNGYCVGSIADEKNDKLYWLISGEGRDIIAEYDFNTGITAPVIVDIFPAATPPHSNSGRALNFDRYYLITGINIVDGILFWTDNNTEPKRVHIERAKLGSNGFNQHSEFWIRSGTTTTKAIEYVPALDTEGNNVFVGQKHLTVIRKYPQTPPTLEMRGTTRLDTASSNNQIDGEIRTTIGAGVPVSMDTFMDATTGFYKSSTTPISLYFDSPVDRPDYKIRDYLIISIEDEDGQHKEIRVQIEEYHSSSGECRVVVLSGDEGVVVGENPIFDVVLEQVASLFQFKFPRFGYRYKYEDGEYSTFSPFTEVAFLPTKFDYLPREGYNLGMVNGLRGLAITNFVDTRSIPEDVISIDILYKESDSPNVYSVKTIKRIDPNGDEYDEWNAVDSDYTTATFPEPTIWPFNQYTFHGKKTTGYVNIKSELIHAVLPENQLLRSWDNVPRKALGQEIVGNRLVYANYLQNYDLANSDTYKTRGPGVDNAQWIYEATKPKNFPPTNSINIDISLSYMSKRVGELYAEQINPLHVDMQTHRKDERYGPDKSIKTLRTYQLGVVYTDEFGRETPVFSNSISKESSLTLPKSTAKQATKLNAQVLSTPPEWAHSFRFFIKETSNEYYNLALDRYYDAEDGNIWLSFPSSERNKVDEETFLILKKEHDSDEFVDSPARYKILSLQNEAPLFIKTVKNVIGAFTDQTPISPDTTTLIGTQIGVGFPLPGISELYLDSRSFENLGWAKRPDRDSGFTFTTVADAKPGGEGVFYLKNPSDFQIRVKSPGIGHSQYYDVKSIEWEAPDTYLNPTIPSTLTPSLLNEGWYKVKLKKPFGDDMSITTTGPTTPILSAFNDRVAQCEVQLIKTEVKNKAEFEGRFFAKIKKDFTLIETIIQPSSTLSTPTYQVVMSSMVQYINPKAATVSGGFTNGWFGVSTASNPYPDISISKHNANRSWPLGGVVFPGDPGEGDDYWKWAGNGSGATIESSGWFIDKIEGFRRFKYTSAFFKGKDSNFHTNAAYGDKQARTGGWVLGNLSSTPWTQNARVRHTLHNFGNQGAYPSQSSPNHMQVIGTCTSGSGCGTTEYMGLPDNRGPAFGGATSSIGKLREQTDILPSQGIDAVNSVIHLSYAGIGVDDNSNAWDIPSGNNWDLNIFNHAFITELMEPGTIWRWKEDPDQIIYKTKTTNASGYTAAEWGANLFDPNDGQDGIQLYNYCKFSDYPLRHHHEHGYTRAGYGYVRYRHSHSNMLSQIVYNHTTGGTPKVKYLYDSGLTLHGSKHQGYALHKFKTSSGWEPYLSNPGAWNRYPMVNDEWNKFRNKRRRYMFHATALVGGGGLGSGPSGYLPTNDPFALPHYLDDGTLLTSATTPLKPSTDAPGIRPDGMYIGHDMPGYSATNTDDLGNHVIGTLTMTNSASQISGSPAGSVTWEILSEYEIDEDKFQSTKPAIFETEPKEDIGLDIYHEVGRNIPVKLNESNIEQFVGPLNVVLSKNPTVSCWSGSDGSLREITTGSSTTDYHADIRVESAIGNSIFLTDIEGHPLQGPDGYISAPTLTGPVPHVPSTAPNRNDVLAFTKSDGTVTRATVINTPSTFSSYSCIAGYCVPVEDGSGSYSTLTGCVTDYASSGCDAHLPQYELDPNIHNHMVTLPWFNCYSFGNGVESDRIRDDYNQVRIDKGPIASTTLEEPYLEERRASGLIYSGIYNSTSGVNNLNQFVQAEKITKDLNPIYGSIQKLHTRDTNLLAFCEDKIFKIFANKDALYNADGNPQLIATNRVLGDSKAFTGEFGISKNPESFASESYRAYFTDKTRGNILRLSQDGVTPISAYGMKDYFADHLEKGTRMTGSYDDKKQEYNVTFDFQKYSLPPDPVAGYILADVSEPCYWVQDEASPGAPPPPGSVQPPGCGELGDLLIPTTLRIPTGYPVAVGDVIVGSGILPGTIITAIHPPLPSGPNVGKRDVEISITPPQALLDTLALPVGLEWEEVLDNNGIMRSIEVALWGYPTNISIYTPPAYVPILTFTSSFSELSKGWISFKSWHQENGISLNNKYYTFKGGQLWEHHKNDWRNNFYGIQYDSSVRVLFNEEPGSVKSFQTINYEGTQSKIESDIDNTGEYWDNIEKSGWYVDDLFTNMQEGDLHEFKNKEDKWFSKIKGVTTKWDYNSGTQEFEGNIDTNEFSYQGIDEADGIIITDGGYTHWKCQEGTCIEMTEEYIGEPGTYEDQYSCLNDPEGQCTCFSTGPFSCEVSGYCEPHPGCTGTNCYNTPLECYNGTPCDQMPYDCLGNGLCWPFPGGPYLGSATQTAEMECILDPNGCLNCSDPHACCDGVCTPDFGGAYIDYADCVLNSLCVPDEPHTCDGGICVPDAGGQYTSAAECWSQQGCTSLDPYECDESGVCYQMAGGTYGSLLDCLSKSICTGGGNWDCHCDTCIPDPNGIFSSEKDCLNATGCNPINPCGEDVIHASHAVTDATGAGAPPGNCWNNGAVSIYVDLVNGFQWDVEVIDPSGNSHFTYYNVMNHTAVLIQFLEEGTGWTYIITDDNGCRETNSFDVGCKPGGSGCTPCAEGGQPPAGGGGGRKCVGLVEVDPTDPDCTNGYVEIGWIGFALPAGVTQWKVQWYTVDSSGVETFIMEDDNSGSWYGATDVVTWYVPQPATYTYKYVVITDQQDEGGQACTYEGYFDIFCEGGPTPCTSGHFGNTTISPAGTIDPCVDSGYSSVTFTSTGQIDVYVGDVGGDPNGLYNVEVWDSWVYDQNHPINTGGTFIDGAGGFAGSGITFTDIIPDPNNPLITGATTYDFVVLISDAFDSTCNQAFTISIDCVGIPPCTNPCGGAVGNVNGSFLYTNYVGMTDCSCTFEGDDQSCCHGCQDFIALNYANTPAWNTNFDCVGNLIPNFAGPLGNTGCCQYTHTSGCMAPNAVNYDPTATIDDGSCCYAGCMDDGYCVATLGQFTGEHLCPDSGGISYNSPQPGVQATNYSPYNCEDPGNLCTYPTGTGCTAPGGLVSIPDYGFEGYLEGYYSPIGRYGIGTSPPLVDANNVGVVLTTDPTWGPSDFDGYVTEVGAAVIERLDIIGGYWGAANSCPGCVRPVNITGIECMPALKVLDIGWSNFSAPIDLSNNFLLEKYTLAQSAYAITSDPWPDFSNNILMNHISITDHPISVAYTNNLSELAYLYLQSCNLVNSSINLNNNPKLEFLNLESSGAYYSSGIGNLTAINVSNNPLLKQLRVKQSNIQNLDLTNNFVLTELDIRSNFCQTIDLGGFAGCVPGVDCIDVSSIQMRLEDNSNLQIHVGTTARVVAANANPYIYTDSNNPSNIFII